MQSPSSPYQAQIRKLVAILAADVAGYASLMAAERRGRQLVRELKRQQSVLLPLVSEHGGRVIDTAGDGILAEFASALRAVECALAIQDAAARRNVELGSSRRMQLRIGINLGDVIVDEARIYGDGINVAARLPSVAEARHHLPFEQCISRGQGQA